MSEPPPFAAAGPSFPALEAQGPVDWQAWRRAADDLSRALAGAEDLDRRIHHLYLPVLFFCAARAAHTPRRPIVIGIQAPQGGGKTTMVTHLLNLLPELGLTAAAVSIDDFYLPRAGQVALAAAHPGNPYLEHRGYPGTHDVALGEATLSKLRGLSNGETLRVPVYDKSQHGGRGDRAPESAWREVSGPLDVVFLEGWMLGFSPVDDAALKPAPRDPQLAIPNRALADYERWHRLLDAFVVLRATDPNYVLKWRVEAEEKMIAAGKPGLSRADIEDYVRRFLPAYATWAGRPPARFTSDETMTIWLDEKRRPVAAP